MAELSFAADHIIFSEGDPSDAVYFVKSGVVAIEKIGDGKTIRLATLREPDVFGEMGVIAGRPHAARAQVIEDASVQRVGREEFLELMRRDPARLMPILRVLADRLRDSDRKLAQQSPSGEATSRLVLGAYSERVRRVLPENGLAVDKLPFRIGRRPMRGEPWPANEIHLVVDDAPPFQVSRQHFAIEFGPGGPLVRDLESHEGTIVNGLPLGKSAGPVTSPLRAGANEVVAGNEHSAFRFKVVVEPD